MLHRRAVLCENVLVERVGCVYVVLHVVYGREHCWLVKERRLHCEILDIRAYALLASAWDCVNLTHSVSDRHRSLNGRVDLRLAAGRAYELSGLSVLHEPLEAVLIQELACVFGLNHIVFQIVCHVVSAVGYRLLLNLRLVHADDRHLDFGLFADGSGLGVLLCHVEDVLARCF